MTKEVVFLSGHYYASERQAGFHKIAAALVKRGCKVGFVTAPFSLFNLAKLDYRMSATGFFRAILTGYTFKNVNCAVHLSLVHPIAVHSTAGRLLSNFFAFLYKRTRISRRVRHMLSTADVVVFESNSALLLFEQVKEINHSAKLIYRCSDLLEFTGQSVFLRNYEKKIVDLFDSVSVPSHYMQCLMQRYSQKVQVIRHGVDVESFLSATTSPFVVGTKNAVFVGVGHVDYKFIRVVAEIFKKVHFTIVGPIKREAVLPNVHYLGEMPFERTVSYIKFADVGLACYEYKAGIEAATDSLKVLQYRRCGLPIVIPDFIKLSEPNVWAYQVGDEESMRRSFESALMASRSAVDLSILSWEDTAERILNA